MAVYTEVSSAEIAGFWARLGLGTPHSMRGVPSGIENTNYFVDSEAGEFVLTLFERLSFDQLPFYLHLMKHLASRGLPVPDPVSDGRGEILHELKGRPAVVVNKLAGRSVTAPTEGHCHAIGEVLAKLHRAGQDFARQQANPRGIAWWSQVAPVVSRPMSDEQQFLLSDELSFQTRFAESPLFRRLPQGPVHADLFRDNALFDGEQLTGVFDFYFAGCDAFLFDVAVCLNDWCIDGEMQSLDEKRSGQLLAGYESVRPLSADERACLPTMQRAAALRFWLSRFWDLHLPRDAAMLMAHDPNHFEQILKRLRGERQ